MGNTSISRQNAAFPVELRLGILSLLPPNDLAPLLPSLEQRCPGLLDPACNLEAAARHCVLAGLEAA